MQTLGAVYECALGICPARLGDFLNICQDRREAGALNRGKCRAAHTPREEGHAIADDADHPAGVGIMPRPMVLTVMVVVLMERFVTALACDDLPVLYRQHLKVRRAPEMRTHMNAVLGCNGDLDLLAHF